jgi:thiamine-phosphate pyrophosphorylase
MFIPYLITDPLYYSRQNETFTRIFEEAVLANAPKLACFRDKHTANYEALAPVFIAQCKALHVKPLLHTHFILAASLDAWGVHLPGNLLHKIEKAKNEGLFVVASTHDIDEAKYAQEQGADAVTFSPIFPTPGKGAGVGLEKLKEIVGILSIDIYALGGIVTQEHIDACSHAGAAGFASIRYFLNHDKAIYV